MQQNSLRSAISLAGSGKKVPAMHLVRNDPEMAALISKLVTPRDQAKYDGKGNREVSNPDTFTFRSISDQLSENIRDSEIIMQLLPDMELWSQILISSILSPKDMMTTELNYAPPAELLPSDVANTLVQLLKNHFEQVYKIKPLLPDILKDVLFKTGSYPVAVIPENSLDEVINGAPKVTMESLHAYIGNDGEIKPIGLLGASDSDRTVNRKITGISFESLSYNAKTMKPEFAKSRVSLEGFQDSYLHVTDNPDLLRVPQINERIRSQIVSDTLGIRAMESVSRLNDRQVAGLVYKNKQAAYKQLVTLKSDSQLYRRTVGEPLIIRIASEAVIPVHIPGSPEKQIGFFILIDSEGNPISKDSVDDQYRMLGRRMTSGATQNFPSAMVEKVNSMMGEGNTFNPNNRTHIDYSVRAYSELVEADLMGRLRNGVYGNGVTIASNQEVYRIMLARTLQKQNTQLLFLPVELMTYFGLKFDTNGIGRSLIDDMKILLSLRIMLMFSNVMASIKNSIGRTEVKLKLDEQDPDPKKTIEIAQHEIIRSRMNAFPIGVSSPTDMVDWLQRAAFEFTFEGHPGLPDVAVDFGEKNTNYTKPDTDLEEQLRKNSIMAAGLNPETVDAGFGAEFATSVVANNILLSKRVIQIQEKITPQLTDHLRKVAIASQPLSDSIRGILKENIDKIKERLTEEFAKQPDEIIIDRVYHDFMYGFEVFLPAPNSVTLDNQKEALDKYIESLDAVLDSYISDKFFTDSTGGNISGDVGVMREVVRAYFIRKWIAENGMLPEIAQLTATSEDGAPMVNFYDEQRAHIDALAKSLTNFMVKVHKAKEENNQRLDKLGMDETGTDGSTSTTTSETGGEGGSEFGGEGGGDFGDFGGDELGGGGDLDFGVGDDTTANTDAAAEPEAPAAPETAEAESTEATPEATPEASLNADFPLPEESATTEAPVTEEPPAEDESDVLEPEAPAPEELPALPETPAEEPAPTEETPTETPVANGEEKPTESTPTDVNNAESTEKKSGEQKPDEELTDEEKLQRDIKAAEEKLKDNKTPEKTPDKSS